MMSRTFLRFIQISVRRLPVNFAVNKHGRIVKHIHCHLVPRSLMRRFPNFFSFMIYRSARRWHEEGTKRYRDKRKTEMVDLDCSPVSLGTHWASVYQRHQQSENVAHVFSSHSRPTPEKALITASPSRLWRCIFEFYGGVRWNSKLPKRQRRQPYAKNKGVTDTEPSS